MKQSLYILSELNDRDFEWLITAGRKWELPTGTTLIREGEAIDALYILLEGTLVVTTKAVGDAPVAELSMGELVGEISFVDSRPPSATVKAKEDAVVWAIPRVQLTGKMLQDTGFASRFYRALAILLSDRLRGATQRLGQSQTQSTDPAAVKNLSPDPEVSNPNLAKVRLDWLLQQLKNTR